MTASVASSPIFLIIASSPFANSVATYDVAGSAPRLAAIVAVSRCNTSSHVGRVALPAGFSGISFAIDRPRVLEHRFDRAPGAVLEPLKETAVPAGMTSDAAALFDDEQDRIVVAIESYLAYALHVAGRLALAPEPVPSTRPVMCLARGRRAFERFAVHPRLREHRPRGCF